MLNPSDLASLISEETGLQFTASGGKDAEGRPWILMHPADADSRHAFGIRTTLDWRRIEIGFEPGSFAGPLLGEMGRADANGRAVFILLLDSCERSGAEIRLQLNGQARAVSDPAIWGPAWSRAGLVLRKGNLEIGDADAAPELEIVREWVLKFAAAIIAILPLDGAADEIPPDNQQGFPEGSVSTVVVNRYERDRRNRAAAIAIHGLACKACGMSFAERYGDVATGFIEVHHVTPVSRLTPDYLINPVTDLVPLCSNCHSVVHRQDPPMAVDALRQRLQVRH